MPATTTKGYPYPLTTDPFLPATTDFPALANAIESKSAREVAAVLSAASVLDVGVVGQVRAGRELVAADFTTLLGLSQPVGLWDAGSLVNLGSGGNLVNKGAVPLTAKGLAGTANHAALFAGSTGQALYIADTGGADPFRIKTGTVAAWMRTAKRGTGQEVISKHNSGATATYGWELVVQTDNTMQFAVATDAAGTYTGCVGVTDVADDRWHFVVGTFDGSMIRLYIDGVLEASRPVAGTINPTTAPLNIGGKTADAGTAAGSPHFGRIAVPFVTADVLSEDEIRVLMAAKVAHGYAVTPTRSHLAVRRKRKGGPLVSADFTVTPKRLYNLNGNGNDTAGVQAITGGAAGAYVAGPDGQTNYAMQFDGATNLLSGPDTGLPTTGATSYGCWFKTTGAGGVYQLFGWGAVGVERMLAMNAGIVSAGWNDVSAPSSSAAYNDGQWHFALVVLDPSAADGQKQKLYIDGRLVAANTNGAGAGTLGGASGLHIGNKIDGTRFFPGTITRVFVTDYAMAEDEILSLFAKGSVALAASEKNQGDHVEAMDATNVYVLFGTRDDDDSTLDSQHSVDLRVAA